MCLIKFCDLKRVPAVCLKVCQFVTTYLKQLVYILLLLLCHLLASLIYLSFSGYVRSAPLPVLYVSLDLKNFVFHDSGRHFNLNDIVGVSADQRLTYRRLVGDLTLKAVSLCGTYDLQLHVFIKLIIMNLNLAAYADSVKINFVLYYNLGILEDLLDLLDTCLDISLLVFCCILLSMLRREVMVAALSLICSVRILLSRLMATLKLWTLLIILSCQGVIMK